MKSNIDNLIGMYLSGNASETEKKELHAWLKESAENERVFKEAEAIWMSSANLRSEIDSDTDAAWKEFEGLVQKPSARTIRLMPLQIAAAVALLLCTFFVVQFFFSEQAAPVTFANNIIANVDTLEVSAAEEALSEIPDTARLIETPVKHKPFVKRKNKAMQLAMIAVSSEDSAMVFTLPDQSKVYLNRHSKLTYPENFTGVNRVVHLSGEAYFEVNGSQEPFFVFCRDTKSRAMAGAFNITGYEDREIEVSVITGIVEVTKVAPSETRIIIGKGEKVTYDAVDEQFVQSKVTKKERWWKRTSFRNKIRNFINRIIHKNN
jgi:transmembrane sensor